MNCEIFAASAAIAAGFSCADFNDIAPGSYDSNLMMFERPELGLPMGAKFDGSEATAFDHPVYTETVWLHRTREILSSAGSRAEQVLYKLARRFRQALADGELYGIVDAPKAATTHFRLAKRSNERLSDARPLAVICGSVEA